MTVDGKSFSLDKMFVDQGGHVRESLVKIYNLLHENFSKLTQDTFQEDLKTLSKLFNELNKEYQKHEKSKLKGADFDKMTYYEYILNLLE
jgi:phage-related tail protein